MADTRKVSRTPSVKCGIKRPISAFMVFSCEKRKDLHKDRKITLTESTKLLSSMWKSMSEKEKEPFVEASRKDKQRYVEELSKIGMSPHRYKRRASNGGKPAKRIRHDGSPSPPPTPTSADGSTEALSGKSNGRNRSQNVSSKKRAKRSGGRSKPVSTQSSNSTPAAVLQNAIVAEVGIPLFTDEFLVYNKKLNSDLMKLRQVNKDMNERKQRLKDALLIIELDIKKFQELIEQQMCLNDSLVGKLQALRNTVSTFVSPQFQLPLVTEESDTAEDLLDRIINEDKLPLVNDDSIVKLIGELRKLI